MAKKKKKKTFALVRAARLCLICSFGLWIFSSLFLRTYNNSLSTDLQNLQAEISALELQNEVNKIEIQRLSSKDRVENIADENSLRYVADNVIIFSTGSDN